MKAIQITILADASMNKVFKSITAWFEENEYCFLMNQGRPAIQVKGTDDEIDSLKATELHSEIKLGNIQISDL
jgi:hypothetical protein